MTLPTSTQAPPTSGSRGPRGLGRAAAGGAMWVLVRTVGMRLVKLVGTVLLTWLLSREAFGLWALVNTVASFTRRVATSGVAPVLVQRGRFDRWGSAGFWLSVATGLIGAGLTVAVAPLAARLYADDQLARLLMLLSPAVALQALALLPRAMIQAELRFREMAGVKVAAAVLGMCLTVALAALGFGVYSFVLPAPMMALFQMALFWRLTRPRIRRPQWRRMTRLAGDSIKLLGAALLTYVGFQADYLILGYVYRDEKAVVGLYFLAFMLSSQLINLLTNNLGQVLLPTLSAMGRDPARQVAAFVRAASALAVVGMPLALLQAAIAEPVMHLVFAAKWHAAIPILQVLSVAMALRLVGNPAHQLLIAQGRFTTRLVFDLFTNGALVGCVSIGAFAGDSALDVAFAVLGAYALMYVIGAGWIIRTCGGRWRDTARVFGPPSMIGGLAVGAGYGLGLLLPDRLELLRVPLTLVVALAIYLPAIRWAMPACWDELKKYAIGLGRRVRRAFRGGAATGDR